jgi:hypothetical protein
LFQKLKLEAQYLNRENKLDYYGIIELWNVDTFEGGSVARSLWLERRAVEFEKKQKGVFILIRNMTVEQALLNLQNGNVPNLISYGIGFGQYILDGLVSYNGALRVRDDLLTGGMVNNAVMAVPIILGGYALITNEVLLQQLSMQEDDVLNRVFELELKQHKTTIPPLSFAGNAYNNAPLSLFLNSQVTGKKEHFTGSSLTQDQYEAYEAFVLKNSSVSLIGTQRDVVRCKNRESNKVDEAYWYTYLGGFSDLVQYMSIVKSDAQTKQMCEQFIAYLTTEVVQQTLTNIAMFSVLPMHIYNDVFYKEWEKELLKPLKTTSVFLQSEVLKNKIELCHLALTGDETAKKQISEWF